MSFWHRAHPGKYFFQLLISWLIPVLLFGSESGFEIVTQLPDTGKRPSSYLLSMDKPSSKLALILLLYPKIAPWCSFKLIFPVSVHVFFFRFRPLHEQDQRAFAEHATIRRRPRQRPGNVPQLCSNARYSEELGKIRWSSQGQKVKDVNGKHTRLI